MSKQTQSKRAYIMNEQSISVFYEGKPYSVAASDTTRYHKVKDAILENDWEKVYKSLDITTIIEDFTNGDISVTGDAVYYKDTERLHGVVVDKLLELLKAGLKDSTPLIKFISNLLENPSQTSVSELYDFLQYKSLPIDEDGLVIGYKGVNDDYMSCNGNTETIVLQGRVDSDGHIFNGVGEKVEVERRCVDDNRSNGCSTGLHIGSHNYATSWGDRTMIVRFNPKDAVSVPKDSSCQKLRVCKYEVIGELGRDDQEIEEPLYNSQGRVEESITLNGRVIPLA